MSRIRYIKPGFFENEDLVECSPLARLLYAGLWCWADREGRLEDRPRRLKAQILPYDDCDVDALLADLERGGFIVRYEASGERYLSIPQFATHQKPHRHEPASVLPAPPEVVPYTDNGGTEPDNGRTATDNVSLERGMGNRNGEWGMEKRKGVKGEGADAPVLIIPSSDVDPRVFEIIDILGEPRTPNNVKYVGLKITAYPDREPVSKALEAHAHILAHPKKYTFPLRVWGNWMAPPKWERETAGAKSNGAAPNGNPTLTPEEIAELEDPDHTGRRRTGFWPIPRGTPAPASTVSEWHDAMQWIIDQGRCDRRDLEDSLCRVTPLPPRDGFLPLRLPPESHVINQVKLGLDEQIRSALQKPGLRPHYFIEGERDG